MNASKTKNMKPKNMKKTKGHTIVELAQAFETSEQSIRNFVAQLKPVGVKGRSKTYDFKEVKNILSSRRSRAPKSEEIRELERRKIDLQCQRLQIDIDERERRLLPVDEVRRCFSIHTSAVRNQLLRQASELAPLLSGLSVAKIEKKINESGEEVLEILRKTEFDESPVGGGAKELTR
ncbi:hypothetical protein N8612_05630 [Verrucomicrobia bacterium]|jgi:hypothetical protein|nr:hypothetical protein [Verrucomicrobiota bacterium]